MQKTNHWKILNKNESEASEVKTYKLSDEELKKYKDVKCNAIDPKDFIIHKKNYNRMGVV